MRSPMPSAPTPRTSAPPDRADEALEVLLDDLREYLKGKTGERYSRFKPQAPEPASEAAHDGPEGESMSEECREGRCDHPEHQKGDDLDALLD